jgi:chemotaxis response regulator CheB
LQVLTRDERRAVRAFYVVGIGASAGGLNALREFFGAMSEKGAAAYPAAYE